MHVPSTSRISLVTASLTTALAVLLLLGAFPAAAQDTSEQDAALADAVAASSPEPPRTVLKMLKYARAADLVNLLRVLDVAAMVDTRSNTLILRGPQGDLETALKIIDAMDEPTSIAGSVELRAYVVRSRQGADGGFPSRLAESLEHVGELVGGQGFELVDTFFLRVTRDSRSGRVSSPLGSDGGVMTFGFEHATILAGEPPTVRFKGLSFVTSDPSTSLTTDVEVRDGQLAVVGKTSLGDQAAMLLVLEVDIVE